jgi:hypothetical protein
MKLTASQIRDLADMANGAPGAAYDVNVDAKGRLRVYAIVVKETKKPLKLKRAPVVSEQHSEKVLA